LVCQRCWCCQCVVTPYLLETYVPGTGPPEDGLGKLIDREIKAAMPPHRPSEADMAAIASSGMDDVLSDYGTERMHDIIMRCATEMPLNGIYRGGVVGHIQRVIRGDSLCASTPSAKAISNSPQFDCSTPHSRQPARFRLT
jgi:hypothetical protein